MEHPLTESVWRRGWQGTWAGWKNPLFGLFDVLGSSVVGAIFGWYWGVGLFLFVMFAVWVGATASAPVKQRNEARATLLKKRKPKPISNKDALVRAISNFKECAVVEFTHHQMRKEHSCKVSDCPLMVDGKSFDLSQAYEVLAAEALVAGERVNTVVAPLMEFVLKQMIEQYNDESSSATKLNIDENIDEFLSELHKIVKKTVGGINALTR